MLQCRVGPTRLGVPLTALVQLTWKCKEMLLLQKLAGASKSVLFNGQTCRRVWRRELEHHRETLSWKDRCQALVSQDSSCWSKKTRS